MTGVPAHGRDGHRPEDPDQGAHNCEHARQLGHPVAALEAAQASAERGALHRGRAAPDRRRGRPRCRDHLLPHALHQLTNRAEHPHRGALLPHRQRQGFFFNRLFIYFNILSNLKKQTFNQINKFR
jgi:hypothetical protein